MKQHIILILTAASLVILPFLILSGCSDSGGSDDTVTQTADTIPPPPENLTATPQATAGQILLTWDDVAYYESGFKVYFKIMPGNPYTLYETTAADATTSLIIGAGSGVKYYFAVSAFNAAGESAVVTAEAIAP